MADIIKYDNRKDLIKSASWSALSENTRAAYQSDFNLFSSIIQKDPAMVTPDDVLQFIEVLEKRDYKTATINRKIASLSKMFHVLKIAGEIKENPVEILKTVKKVNRTASKEVSISLTMDDIQKTIKHCDNNVIREIIHILSITGLRVSEFINIKNFDVTKFDNKLYKIRIVGKGKKERFVYLEKSTMDGIKKIWPVKYEYVFYLYPGIKYSRKTIWRWIKTAFKDAIGKDVHPHTLRHFFATQKIHAEKKDIKAVSLYLGHADVSTTLRIYVDTSLSPEDSILKIKK